MVEVRDVQVGVFSFVVFVKVTVPADESVGVDVVVVAVVVVMFVGVQRRLVSVLVDVCRAQRKSDTDGGDGHRDQLHWFDRVGQHDP